MICKRCDQPKGPEDFYPSDPGWCKGCRYIYNKENRHKFRERDKAYAKEYRKLNPEKVKQTDRNCKLKKAYGITIEEFDSMLEAQGNRCKICRESSEKFHVDHDHKTGIVRGILCNLCNVGLGAFRDNVAYLENAIKYLED